MLDTFFNQIKVRSRMESGPIGPHLSEIAAVLHRDGYTHGTIRRHLRAADHFGAWLVGYLTRPEIDAILAANNLSEWSGRRDHVLLLTLYNTGARVSEITSTNRKDTFGVQRQHLFENHTRQKAFTKTKPELGKANAVWVIGVRESSCATP